MAELTNRVAVVTGGRRGIGRAIAELLAQRGADVMIGDCTDDPGLSTAAEIAAATGRRVQASCVDVSKSQSAKDFIDHAVAEFGHVDILVNNAGIRRDNLRPAAVCDGPVRRCRGPAGCAWGNWCAGRRQRLSDLSIRNSAKPGR